MEREKHFLIYLTSSSTACSLPLVTQQQRDSPHHLLRISRMAFTTLDLVELPR